MNLMSSAKEALRLRQRQEQRTLNALIAPGTIWLIVFFMLPLGLILIFSFLTRGTPVQPIFNPDNYPRLLDRDYFIIFQRSLSLAGVTTVCCLLAGYPMAYFIARQPRTRRNVLLLLVILPFWTNFLVRTYAIKVMLQTQGVVNTLLLSLGIVNEPLTLLYTPGAVLLGMIYGFLPFMVLPLYATLEKFDFTLIEAAHDSGANDFWALVRIMLPLTMPGIVAGSILVFIPAIGAFITPDILGGSKATMIGNLIDQQFKKGAGGGDWPFASAMSITLMVMVSIATAIYFRLTTESERL